MNAVFYVIQLRSEYIKTHAHAVTSVYLNIFIYICHSVKKIKMSHDGDE